MILKKPLAQNLAELSHITENLQLETSWSGAVNMIFVEDCMLLIKRSDEMPSHKGQVGFLGGHKHRGELEPRVTGFRELEEESGIDSSEFEFMGLADPVYTSQKRVIIPVVSRYKLSKVDLITKMISNGEWSDFILTELSYLQNPQNWHLAKMYSKREFNIYFVPLTQCSSTYHPTGAGIADYLLWGATAKMIWNFFKKNF